MDIKREELDHILTQFSWKNLYEDMAMFFITQDMDFDDMFCKDWVVEPSFYKNVFRVIYAYVINKIDRGQYELAIRDVFLKIKCNRYDARVAIDGRINRDGLSILLIKKTLEYLVRDGDIDTANHFIDICMVNPNFNRDVMFGILKSAPDLCHQSILSNLISGEYLSIEDIYELIIMRAKVTPLSTIKDLVLEIFNNKEMLLGFASCVYKEYNIWIDTKGDDKTIHLDNKSKGERKEIVDNLRDFMIEIIWIDAELEYYDFLNESKVAHRSCKNMYMAQIYDIYIRWFGSKSREENFMSNYIWTGHEENCDELYLNDQALGDISRDVCMLKYITDMGLLDGYDLFIRMFNINRFLISNYNNFGTIKRHIDNNIESNSPFIWLAVDTSFYIFLCLR